MRKAGVLLSIASLPSAYGIGDFGSEAVEFLRLLKKNGFKLWQILPLNPVGYGNSPYQAYSSYAMDEIYISLDRLKEQGLIKKTKKFEAKSEKIDFDAVRHFKTAYLKEAYENFKEDKSYRQFCKVEWLEDYVHFRALKNLNHNELWTEWKIKSIEELDSIQKEALLEEMNYHRFLQYILFCQWNIVRKEAKKLKIEIMGDMPFYVGLDSADVWGNQSNFLLDDDGRPEFIAGVPPDYFSATGQRWGNPIYDWDEMEENGFDFWIQRLSWASQVLDCIRIDHFRAFDTYWKIPSSCPTAIEGEWIEAPGYEFFDTLFKKLPNIEIVAEDLGMMRDEVYQLRDHYHFKGMKIIQFTYDKYNAVDQMKDRVALIGYTGTHDNETLQGWLNGFSAQQKRKATAFLKKAGCTETSLSMKFIEYLLNSQVQLSILAAQDILGLDNSARMNEPGTVGYPNWQWKLKDFKKMEIKLEELKPLVKKARR